MKILIISPTSSGIGGIAQYVRGLIDYLKKHGNEVKVISSENTFTIPIKGLKNPSFLISSFFKSKFQKEVDIVHAQNPASALAMKNVSGKKILSLQGMFAEQIELLHGNTAGKLSASFEKNALDWADAITVPNKEMYDYYSKKGYNTFYIPNAIDISSFTKKTERKFEKQIIYAGRLSKEKGILILLEMSKKLPEDINLIIIGSGPEEELVKKISKEKSNMHFLGYQRKEKTISLIRGSDILIQPSLIEGGTSSTLLEAMACKIPIIATRVGGNKETIRHLETAYVVETNSPNQILNGILELFSDKLIRTKLVEGAFKEVKEYDWENVGKKYLDLYKNLCQA